MSTTSQPGHSASVVSLAAFLPLWRCHMRIANVRCIRYLYWSHIFPNISLNISSIAFVNNFKNMTSLFLTLQCNNIGFGCWLCTWTWQLLSKNISSLGCITNRLHITACRYVLNKGSLTDCSYLMTDRYVCVDTLI